MPATKSLLPVRLIAYFAFSNKYIAFNFEKYLKSGSGRALIKKNTFKMEENRFELTDEAKKLIKDIKPDLVLTY